MPKRCRMSAEDPVKRKLMISKALRSISRKSSGPPVTPVIPEFPSDPSDSTEPISSDRGECSSNVSKTACDIGKSITIGAQLAGHLISGAATRQVSDCCQSGETLEKDTSFPQGVHGSQLATECQGGLSLISRSNNHGGFKVVQNKLAESLSDIENLTGVESSTGVIYPDQASHITETSAQASKFKMNQQNFQDIVRTCKKTVPVSHKGSKPVLSPSSKPALRIQPDNEVEHENEIYGSASTNQENGTAPPPSPEHSAGSPLYQGARISLNESVTSILTYAQTEHITGIGLSRLLRLIDLHLPEENNFVRSTDKFVEVLGTIDDPFDVYYYCSACWSPRSSLQDICDKCNVLKRKVHYFITFSLIHQLRKLYKQKSFLHNIKYKKRRTKFNANNIEDIYDGELYKLAEALMEEFDITLMWNTDGVALYESSNFDIWPFFFVINELPPEERFKTENVLLGGIWGSKDKPHPNIFLPPICKDLVALREGVAVEMPDCREQIIHARVLCGTCDSPARAAFFNMKSHMGHSCCFKCMVAGKKSKEETGDTMAFPFEEELRARTDEMYEDQVARSQEDEKKGFDGVKGPTLLYFITILSMLRSTVPDAMHCVYIGVVKQLLTLWFSTTHHLKPFSLSKETDKINEILSNICMPDFVQRLPLPVDKLVYWKASLFRNFFFHIMLPVLKGIMKDEYFEHLKLFVDAISILNGSSICPDDIQLADHLLKEFVKQFQVLYGVRHMSYNVHLLRHLAKCVSDLGGLWVTHCFWFEDLNGRLANMTHGTTHAALQIARNFSLFKSLPSRVDSLEPGPVKSFNESLMYKWKRLKCNDVLAPRLFSVGTYDKKALHSEIITDFLSILYPVRPQFCTFSRLFSKKHLYVASSYSRSSRVSNNVKYRSSEGDVFGGILTFVKVINLDDSFMFFALINRKDVLPFCENRKLDHLHGCVGGTSTDFISVEHLLYVCFKIEVNGAVNISVPLNCYELE